MIKYRWKVAPEPTGRYRSFEARGWPTAETSDGALICTIFCRDPYRPRQVALGQHGELTVRVRFACDNPITQGRFRWVTLKRRCGTLAEAKHLFESFLLQNPDHNFGL